MNRETIVNFCNAVRKNPEVGMEIIASYCEDMGKDSEYVKLFIQALHIMPIFNSEYLGVALDYFKRKYGIFELYQGNICILTY